MLDDFISFFTEIILKFISRKLICTETYLYISLIIMININ